MMSSLKERREKMLLQNQSYRSIHEKVETPNVLMDLFAAERPDVVIHLAAQAGVRYSIENPRAYLKAISMGPLSYWRRHAHFLQNIFLASLFICIWCERDMPLKKRQSRSTDVFLCSDQESLPKIWRIVIHIYLNYLLRCFGFLRCMDHGVAQTWHCLSLQRPSLIEMQLMFIITEI